MEHGEKEYRLLKSAYAFLNRQISLYEKTVERKVAEYNLLTMTRQQTREAGMNEHIAKPLDAKLLMRKIMEYCKRRDA